MSIPRIAISNEDDSTLQLFESRSRSNVLSNSPSPHKSIIKTRSSQPQSPASSTTTQSFHTCIDSSRKQSFDHVSDISTPRVRSHTVSIVKPQPVTWLDKRPTSLYRNHTFTTSGKASHRQHDFARQPNLLNPVRTFDSNRTPAHHRRSFIRDSQSAKAHAETKRRSTIDHFTYPADANQSPSVYGTPEHQQTNQGLDNAIRLVVETDSTMQGTINDQSDMQVETAKAKAPARRGVSVRAVG